MIFMHSSNMEDRIETIKASLTELGLVSQPTEDAGWYSTQYSGITFRYTVREKEDYMTMAVAIDHGHDSLDAGKVLALVNRVNRRISYIKVFEDGGYFWLAYERDIEAGAPDGRALEKMVLLLTGAYYHFWEVFDLVIGLEDTPEGPDTGPFDWNDYLTNGSREEEE